MQVTVAPDGAVLVGFWCGRHVSQTFANVRKPRLTSRCGSPPFAGVRVINLRNVEAVGSNPITSTLCDSNQSTIPGQVSHFYTVISKWGMPPLCRTGRSPG